MRNILCRRNESIGALNYKHPCPRIIHHLRRDEEIFWRNILESRCSGNNCASSVLLCYSVRPGDASNYTLVGWK